MSGDGRRVRTLAELRADREPLHAATGAAGGVSAGPDRDPLHAATGASRAGDPAAPPPHRDPLHVPAGTGPELAHREPLHVDAAALLARVTGRPVRPILPPAMRDPAADARAALATGGPLPAHGRPLVEDPPVFTVSPALAALIGTDRPRAIADAVRAHLVDQETRHRAALVAELADTVHRQARQLADVDARPHDHHEAPTGPAPLVLHVPAAPEALAVHGRPAHAVQDVDGRVWTLTSENGRATWTSTGPRPLVDVEPAHEWQCPGCGTTTRARMADHPTRAGDPAAPTNRRHDPAPTTTNRSPHTPHAYETTVCTCPDPWSASDGTGQPCPAHPRPTGCTCPPGWTAAGQRAADCAHHAAAQARELAEEARQHHERTASASTGPGPAHQPPQPPPWPRDVLTPPHWLAGVPPREWCDVCGHEARHHTRAGAPACLTCERDGRGRWSTCPGYVRPDLDDEPDQDDAPEPTGQPGPRPLPGQPMPPPTGPRSTTPRPHVCGRPHDCQHDPQDVDDAPPCPRHGYPHALPCPDDPQDTPGPLVDRASLPDVDQRHPWCPVTGRGCTCNGTGPCPRIEPAPLVGLLACTPGPCLACRTGCDQPTGPCCPEPGCDPQRIDDQDVPLCPVHDAPPALHASTSPPAWTTHPAVLPISRALLVDAGAVQPTPEEARELAASRARHEAAQDAAAAPARAWDAIRAAQRERTRPSTPQPDPTTGPEA